MKKLIQLAIGSVLLLTCQSVLADTREDLLDGELQLVAGDFGFLEGPVWHQKEGALYLSDMKQGKTFKYTPGGDFETVREKLPTSNGLAIDANGNLLICENGARRVSIRTPEETETVLVDNIGGDPLGNPNDVWTGVSGTFFTIPDRRKKDPTMASGDIVQGVIIAVPPEGGDPRVVSGALDMRSPNGIVGGNDGKFIYYTDRGGVWKAKVGNQQELSDPVKVADTGWDGLTLDGNGNIYTCSKEGLSIYSPEGALITDIKVPEATANFCFGGSDGKILYIAARTGLYSIKMKVKGDAFTDAAPLDPPEAP